MFTDFHVWEINVSTTLLSILNNISHICHALSFQKHSLIICASERSKPSCILISQELQFNAFAFHISTWKYKRLTHWQATDKRSISRKYARSKRAWKFFAFISTKNSYIFQCLSWYLRIIWHVSRLLCYICAFNAYYYWHGTIHYKRLTSYRQNTHIEIIYSMRARKGTEQNLYI